MIVVGVMSGTSADGIDVAICKIDGKPGTMQVNILAGETYPYTLVMRQRILDCCDLSTGRADKIARLNMDLAEIFAQAVIDLCAEKNIPLSHIHLIGSHGQTIWHEVDATGQVNATFQIGEGAVIAERTGVTTINNLRARDVVAGGQGAPLTGYVDWLLLRHPTVWRAVQNIGGMGNVTFLPPLSDQETDPVCFDTGPGNALIDAAVSHFTNGELTYDRDGQMAAQGQLGELWLDDLMQHPYFARGYPKTTGRELFGTQAALEMITDAQARGLNQYDIIATLTVLTAMSIADAYRRFAPGQIGEVILGGGGQHNPVLVRLLSNLAAPAIVKRHEDVGLSSDYKEALVFAILAYETWHGRVGTLPALTGAQHATVLGQIIPGANFRRLLQNADD